MTDTEKKLTKKDFDAGIDVRWCPGCGDYAILAAVQRTLPDLPYKREDYAFISGIGCSSRFPYYMNTYGFHSIHGRAPAIATGLKVTRPDLEVWIATGDGDSMSIGGNHLIHDLRRNVGVKILVFNNRIYGLTKGQYSPTSEVGKRTKSTPFGSIDRPFNPTALALGAGATFVARSVDIFQPHLKSVLKRAAAHRGSAFVEIYQNCNIFNDKAFEYMTDKEGRVERTLYLEHGKPVVWAEAFTGGPAFINSPRDLKAKGDWAFTKDDRVMLPTLCQFGRDYAGARDGYVYHYLIRYQSEEGPDDYEDVLDRARIFGQEQQFLIGVRVLADTISVRQAGYA